VLLVILRVSIYPIDFLGACIPLIRLVVGVRCLGFVVAQLFPVLDFGSDAEEIFL